MDPHLIDRDYTRLLPSKEIASLKISSRSELLVLVVAILRETTSDSSVNLKAPLLINHTTMMGRQIILPDLDMRAPVPGLVGDASAPLPASIG
jgi:flagellar assembly factor FliW